MASSDWSPALTNLEQFLASSSASDAFRSALPYAHIAVDNLFPLAALKAVANEIPERMNERTGCVDRAQKCYRPLFNTRPGALRTAPQVKKSELDSAAMGPTVRSLFNLLRSRAFLQLLERLSGIPKLIPDPAYYGSGVHLIGRRGRLQVHADFNILPQNRSLHRRLNTFIYLNEDWHESYGGHLELWPRNMSKCARRILPTFGRFVAFASTDKSFHGHPKPLSAPPHRMRRSIAFYYYSETPPIPSECLDGQCEVYHDVLWQKDPPSNGHSKRGEVSRFRTLLHRVIGMPLPPRLPTTNRTEPPCMESPVHMASTS